ncbi:MAG: hypothetical protein QOH39_2127 [Verrucomicrobiota bacterium]|jgi:hypothetical protein
MADGIGCAALRGMLLALGIIAVIAMGALGVITRSLSKSPEGYEDEQGFHLIRSTKGSAVLLRRKSRQTHAGSLKGARANV